MFLVDCYFFGSVEERWDRNPTTQIQLTTKCISKFTPNRTYSSMIAGQSKAKQQQQKLSQLDIALTEKFNIQLRYSTVSFVVHFSTKRKGEEERSNRIYRKCRSIRIVKRREYYLCTFLSIFISLFPTAFGRFFFTISTLFIIIAIATTVAFFIFSLFVLFFEHFDFISLSFSLSL